MAEKLKNKWRGSSAMAVFPSLNDIADRVDAIEASSKRN